MPKEQTEALLHDTLSQFHRLAFENDGGSSRFNTKLEIYMETMGTKIMVLFLGIYLGIVFLLCSAAVLALQQLSQAADNAPRYRILARLGAEEIVYPSPRSASMAFQTAARDTPSRSLMA